MSWAGSTWRVHVLAAVCWRGRALKGKRPVGHRCQSRACFNPAHLFVASSPSRLASLQKTRARGERSSKARISLLQAQQILAALALGSETHVEIAQRLSTSVGIVWDIARGRTWKHLPRS